MGFPRMEHHPVLDVPADRAEWSFFWDGRPMSARDHDTIASALIANGVHVFGRHPRDGAAQGLFCANGQCAQCLVLADGRPVKACITAVAPGMRVESLTGAPELPPDDAPRLLRPRLEGVDTDVLIVGGGPAGLTAARELGEHGVRTLLCDDRSEVGGKLILQTHNFFGSVSDGFAGVRGPAIARRLEEPLASLPSVTVWTDAPVVGVFDGGVLGVVHDGGYVPVRTKRLLIAAGAREKALAFPGGDLPGVLGAGAFQTLLHRDYVVPSRRLLVVGAGNVGLIVAYQALQAGVDVVAVVEAMSEVGGYKVHRDKLVRLGVPVYTSTTVVRAEGHDRVERAVLARVDPAFRPVPGTEAALEVDTILLAVGLSPVRELYQEASRLGVPTYAAGDADAIAEASAAMYSGRIAARRILHDLGVPTEVPEEWLELRATLSSRPGPVLGAYPLPSGARVYPVVRCGQEIPCDPCTHACPRSSLVIPEGNLVGRPKLVGDCSGCLLCVAVCPGLAITLVDRRVDRSGARAKVTVPWEMPEGEVAVGETVRTADAEGERVGTGRVVRLVAGRALGRRRMLVLDVPAAEADRVAGVRIRDPIPPTPVPEEGQSSGDGAIVCRCERVTRESVAEYVRATGTRDVNAVKAALRTGMGPCGGKTCGELVLRIFRELGIEPSAVTHGTHRPFVQEVPILAFVSEASP